MAKDATYLSYQLSRGEVRADAKGWKWADMDGKRLVWAVKGGLWTGMMRRDGIQQINLLHDFNGMKFEPLMAPYEGGRPVGRKLALAKPSLPEPVRPSTGKKSRPPIRLRPDRSKIRPGGETDD